MATFVDLQAEVTRHKTVIEAAINVINGIPAKVATAVTAATAAVDGAAVDQTAFDALYTELKAQGDALFAVLNPPATPAA